MIDSQRHTVQVLVLGSSPTAVIVPSQYVYAANASAGYFKDQLSYTMSRKVTSVLSASELDYELRDVDPKKKEWLSTKKQLVVESDSDEIIIYGANIYLGAKIAFKGSLQEAKINFLTSHDVWHLIRMITGRRCPTLTFKHFLESHISWFAIIKTYLKDVLIRKLFPQNDISGLFRPSTGIICLLLAISRHGQSAVYNISGISFDSRGVYPDSTRNTWSAREKLKDFHLIIDRYILNKLSRKYSIILVSESSS